MLRQALAPVEQLWKRRTASLRVNAIESPFLLIFTLRDGKKRVVAQRSRREGAPIPLLKVLRGEQKRVEVIDGEGRYFSRVATIGNGIDWAFYRLVGGVAPLVFFMDVLFLNLMIRVCFHSEETPAVLSLKEVKSKISEAISSNPDIYTHAPLESMLGRIRAAKSMESLMNGINRD